MCSRLEIYVNNFLNAALSKIIKAMKLFLTKIWHTDYLLMLFISII